MAATVCSSGVTGTKRRFATLQSNDLDQLQENKDSLNSKKSMEYAVRIFRAYLTEKDMSPDFENLTAEELCPILSKFWAEVRTEDGEVYKKKSLITIRHGLQRYISTKSNEIDIVSGQSFKESTKMFQAVCADLKKQGKGGVQHYPPLEKADLQKLYAYFDIEDNVKLLQKVFIDIMLYFGRRGRENLADLRVTDFACTTDSSGARYIYLVKDERTKNHQNDSNTAEGRMYEVRDDDICPVKSFLKYIRKLNPDCRSFFQRPSKMQRNDKWYDSVAVGHNTLGSMMSTLSEKAGLSKRYTNHSLRATTVTILDAANIPGRHIMAVTGHKSESSLKTYSGMTDESTKMTMSNEISKKISVTKAVDKENIPVNNSNLQLCAASTTSNPDAFDINNFDALDFEDDDFEDLVNLMVTDNNNNAISNVRSAQTINYQPHYGVQSVNPQPVSHPQPIIQNCNVTINYITQISGEQKN